MTEKTLYNTDNVITMTFDMVNCKEVIKDIYSTINQWDFSQNWTKAADNQPDDYFKKNYPYVKVVEFMTATGGSESRDLYNDPLNRDTLTDYKFDSLINACETALRQGLKPNIKTGNVPLKFCAEPFISEQFGVNVRPPDDDKYCAYYDYIKAAADALILRFGLTEVRKWSWCVLTEYENKDWFKCEGDETGEATREAFFKLYDYSVGALQASVGKDYLVVGAHAMLCDVGHFDPRDFIEHCAYGTNYFTGEVGSQVNYWAFSIYDLGPGNYSFGRRLTLTLALDFLRDKAKEVGFNSLRYGIDEGYLLFGADGKLLNASHVTAQSYQGAYTAKHYKEAILSGLDWYSLWAFNTESIWGIGDNAADSVGTHTVKLGSKMAGDFFVPPVSITGKLKSNDNQVDGFAGYNSGKNTIHIIAYNYNPDEFSQVGESLNFILYNVYPVDGNSVNIKCWYVDDNVNWLSQWMKDQEEHGVTDEEWHHSKYCVDIIHSTFSEIAQKVWYDHVKDYIEISTLTCSESTEIVKGGKLTLSANLEHHGVVFYEITGVKNKRTLVNET